MTIFERERGEEAGVWRGALTKHIDKQKFITEEQFSPQCTPNGESEEKNPPK